MDVAKQGSQTLQSADCFEKVPFDKLKANGLGLHSHATHMTAIYQCRRTGDFSNHALGS
jgi:hypothetical protein